MYVVNSKDVDIEKFYCAKAVADYLVKEKNIPLFGREGSMYVFRMSDKLRETVDSMPEHLRTIHLLLQRR